MYDVQLATSILAIEAPKVESKKEEENDSDLIS